MYYTKGKCFLLIKKILLMFCGTCAVKKERKKGLSLKPATSFCRCSLPFTVVKLHITYNTFHLTYSSMEKSKFETQIRYIPLIVRF